MARRRARSTDRLGEDPEPGRDSLGRLAEILQQAWARPAAAADRPVKPFKAPVFDGAGDVKLFIGQFLEVAEVNQWDHQSTLLHLRDSLKDEAKDCSRPGQVEHILAELRARYGLTPREARARLSGLRKEYATTLQAHAVEVTRLVTIAYRELPGIQQDELAVETFCGTLGNLYLQRHLLAVPTPTLSDAVRAGNEYLQIRAGSGNSAVRSMEDDSETDRSEGCGHT